MLPPTRMPRRSDMVFRADSDASHLSESGSRSRAAGFWYLGTASDNSPIRSVLVFDPKVINNKAEGNVSLCVPEEGWGTGGTQYALCSRVPVPWMTSLRQPKI